jgi:hypothetical protein
MLKVDWNDNLDEAPNEIGVLVCLKSGQIVVAEKVIYEYSTFWYVCAGSAWVLDSSLFDVEYWAFLPKGPEGRYDE